MHYLKPLLLASAASAASALVLVPRTDEQTVFRSLLQIDNDTQAFTNEVTSWNGDIMYALGLYTTSRTLQIDVDQATNDTLALNQTVSDEYAQAAIDWFTNTLQPDVNQSFAALVARKQDLARNNLTSFVVSSLQAFQVSAGNLSDALVAKAPADKQDGAKQIATGFASEFESALKEFQ